MAAGVIVFYSSSRRHTKYIGDWSSDVCSSELARKEQEELERREREYRRGAALTDLRGRVIILVDDGLATRSEERRVGNECRSRRSGRPASCRPRPQGSATA